MSQIRCPNCQTLIDIDQVLYQQLEAQAKKRLEQKIEEHQRQLKKAKEALRQKELELQTKEATLAKEAQLKAQELLEEELAKERQRLEEQIRHKIQKEQELLIDSLQKELQEKSSQLIELQKAKLQIQKLQQEKEQIELKTRLEAQQRMSEELAKAKEEIARQIAAEQELKLKEKEKQLQDLSQKLEEAQRKANLTSQQLQGEVMELAIEEWLERQFPLDTIQEIKKGQRGADCLQIVNTRELPNCGTIYYESKRTKEFKKEWIEKLKADMRLKGADIGVIVTQTMPKGMERMGLVDGIWVCSFDEFKALSQILRTHIIQLAAATKSQEKRGDKMSMLYDYLTSNEFRMHIEAIVEGFMQMKEDLEREKRAMHKLWSAREKQIEKVLLSTTQMYGAIQGIAGSAVAQIESLEFKLIED
ncbi:MAG: DUF2130 domain-containing protein [Epsilonproteobacteria bacterium]|nr:DUF2130 domain-containing protein [Campylobacterota bacterium]NPA64291.1 DUF2130 domain-containing protein [Campylobacterota bacterium]